jgi:hypothetical protein
MAVTPEHELGSTVTELKTESEEMTLDELIAEMAKLKLAESRVHKLNDYQRKALERIAELQSKQATEELTSPEIAQLALLKDTVRTGEPPPSFVHINDLLLERVGPEAFKRIQKRKSELEAERKALKDLNDEMQRQVELLQKPVSTPIGPMLNTSNLSGVSTPGTYVVEIGERGVVNSAHLITPKEVSAMKPNLWTRFARLFRKTNE